MYPPEAHSPAARTNFALFAVVALPVLAFVLLQYLGLLSLARLAVLGAVAGVLGLSFFVRPRLGIYFMLFHVYAGLSFYLPGFVPLAVMATVLSATLLDCVGGGRLYLRDAGFLWAVALFAIIALQSILWARDPYFSFVAFSQFAKAAALVFLIVQFIRTPEDLRAYGWWIFVGAVATVALGVVNLKLGLETRIHAMGGVGIVRFAGAHANPNYAAAIMISAIPMGVFAIRYTSTVVGRLAAAAGVVTLTVGVFATFSRSALFAFAFVALAVLLREVRSRKTYLGVLIVLLVGVLLTPKYYWIRLGSLGGMGETLQHDWSLMMRMKALGTSWDLFTQHPLAGVGLNNFIVRSADDMLIRIGVHNLYLEILCGVGIIGFLAYAAIHYAALKQLVGGIRAAWAPSDAWIGRFSYYLMIAFISTLISGLFASDEFNYMIWVPVAGALAIGNLRRGLTAGG